MNRKHNTISFYCSWILPYILSKAILLDAHLEFYLIEETKQALFFFEKLDKKEKIDDEFVSDFSQFCIYVSNMRLTIQSSITITNELNQQGFDDTPMIFKSEDLILLDRLLQVLYDNYRNLVEFGTMDKSDNFFFVT